MNGPTGLIFAMRARYENQSGSETFYNEVDSAFSGQDAGFDLTGGFSDGDVGLGTTAQSGTNPAALNPVGYKLPPLPRCRSGNANRRR